VDQMRWELLRPPSQPPFPPSASVSFSGDRDEFRGSVERDAGLELTTFDAFATEVMHRLGRPTRPMAELIFRITGKEGNRTLSIPSSHPFTGDRLKRMSEENRVPSGPPLLAPEEWTSLKAICGSGG